MKKLIFSLIAVFAFTFNAFADVDPYVIDDNAIDEVFTEAVEVSLGDLNATLDKDYSLLPDMQNGLSFEAKSRVSPWAAWAICTFLGGFGVHRHYMGTRGGMWAIYTFTCGGLFGVVTTVDWIVLLIGAIQDDIRDYQNNDSFFMWL